VTLGPDRLTAVGTDSFRLSVAAHPFAAAAPGRDRTAVVPPGAVAAVLAALTDPHELVRVTLGNLFAVETERLRLQTATVTHSKFLPYENILAAHVKKAGVRAEVDPAAFLAAVRQAATMTTADDARVEFAFSAGADGAGTLVLSTASAFGGLEVECPLASYAGGDTRFAADPVFLRDFLAVRGAESAAPLLVRIVGPQQPFVFDAAADWQYLMAAMTDPE
jgi:hypothetical protein